MDRLISIGQHLITGFQGTEVSDELRREVHKRKIGNVILFSENVRDNRQLRALSADIRRLIIDETGIEPFITIDQEGGIVSRLKSDAAIVPGAMSVAATGDPQNAYLAGLITGRELHALGVNFNFAPDADVNSNILNPVIGTRSYGDDPHEVSRYVLNMLSGLKDGGVLGCVKHFPGHGDTSVDSHLGLPVVDKSMEALADCELIPFRAAIEAGVPAVMTTHILFPQIEPNGVPATLSKRILTGLLRDRLGFQGLIVTDCMMMGAIAKHFGTVAGCVRALEAGVDLGIVSHSIQLAGEVCDAAREALERGELSAETLAVSAERIMRFKRGLAELGGREVCVPGCEEHRAIVAGMTRKSVTALDGDAFELGGRPLFIGCAPSRPTPASDADTGTFTFADTLRGLLGGDAITTPDTLHSDELAELSQRFAGHSSVVIGLDSGRENAGQLALVRAAAAVLPVCCVALRTPYMLAQVPRTVYRLATYAYDREALCCVAQILTGQMAAQGRLPVQIGGGHCDASA